MAIIALGIGPPTAIFTVVYGVMLRPLPFHEPERLVTVWFERGAGSRLYPSAADAQELRQLHGVFTDVALVRSSHANLSWTATVSRSGCKRRVFHQICSRSSASLRPSAGVCRR